MMMRRFLLCLAPWAAAALQGLGGRTASRRLVRAYDSKLREADWCAKIAKTVGSTTAMLDLLREASETDGELGEAVYGAAFGFPLDDFQLEALKALRRGKNVVVSAPTGSGKTVAAELAILYALARGQRVLYTTPLKALSNQKFSDFARQFGAENVGLSTGDSGINRDAPIVVMTTEVFRNMLYDGEELESVFAVVFDEFHYMNDAQRGTVWEESLISCPASTRIVALSATCSNTLELKGWLESIHGPTEVVESDFRPVPLRYEYADAAVGLLPLFKAVDVGPGSVAEAVERARLTAPSSGGTRARARKRLSLNPKLERARLVVVKEEPRNRKEKREKPTKPSGPMSMRAVAGQLKKRSLLPAIFFSFSRAGCDQAAEELAMSSLTLLTKEQTEEVARRVDAWKESHPQVAALKTEDARLSRLYRGVASHHAGLLPQHKSLIEDLFKAGLIRCCFATETLAAGVNLPARTTVITSLSKRGAGGAIVSLSTSALLQMAGRAGRRGLDDAGSVVIMRSRWKDEDAEKARRLLTSKVEPIKSHFRSTFGMACALLRSNKGDLDRCRTLVERSFGTYLLQRQLGPLNDEDDTNIEVLSMQYEELTKRLDIVPEDIRRYTRLKTRLEDLASTTAVLTRDSRTPELVVTREVKALEKAEKAVQASRVGAVDEADRVKLMELHAILQRASRRSRRKKEYDDVDSPAWQAFVSVCGVLGDQGALEDDSPDSAPAALTSLGELVAAMNGDNELLLAMATRSDAVLSVAEEGTIGEFAALASTLVVDMRKVVRVAYHASERVASATEQIWEEVCEPLLESQLRRGLDPELIPVRVDDVLAGLVESFAAGCEWSEISESTQLDHGDLIRLFRRTLDLLRSLAALDAGLFQTKERGLAVKAAAGKAARALDRSPVRDDFLPLLTAQEEAGAGATTTTTNGDDDDDDDDADIEDDDDDDDDEEEAEEDDDDDADLEDEDDRLIREHLR